MLLFSGPPGTGKTFTAEAVAGELGRSLCRLRIEEAISKWRGVGEKRTVAAFREAQEHGDVLLLDEVDALLSSRTEGMKNWEVSEINVFLQELERFTGVVILTTNRAESLDPALERRVTARVEFGIPTVADRLLLWKLNLPPRAPLAGDVDLPRLAASYPLTGAVIRTVCRLGSIRAAQREGDERVIRQADLEDVAAAHGMRGVGTKSVIGFR